MKSIKTTIPDIDMLSDDIIEALTEELMESEDPLGIDVDIEEQESR